MPPKKQSQGGRRRSTRIQNKEEEKSKRTNLKDLLKRSNSSIPKQSSQQQANSSINSSIEHDGDFIFKRSGFSQPVTDFEKQLNASTSNTKKQSSSRAISKSQTKSSSSSRPQSKQDFKTKIPKQKQVRRLNQADVSITPQRHSPRKRRKQSRKNDDDDDNDEYREQSTSFQIALPISDTPIIQRNLKYRKDAESNGARRSSLGNRGKRVSSIGNGFTAVPHDKVPMNQFYKHLDSNLPDPHKMRQLLTWIAKKVLEDDKNRHIKRKNKLPNEELTALNIAKFIKEELVNDLSNGKINISWWNREDEEDEENSKSNDSKSANGETLKKALLPNEKNIKNSQVLNELNAKLDVLKKESSNWEKHLDKKIDIPSISSDFNISEPPVIPSTKDDTYNEIINSQKIAQLSKVEDQIFNQVNNNLEQSVDGFTEFVHLLKSSSSLRSRFSSLKTKQLNGILDNTFDDDTIELIKANNNNNGQNNGSNRSDQRVGKIDTHTLLKGIAKLEE